MDILLNTNNYFIYYCMPCERVHNFLPAQDEIRLLHQKVKESELAADKDKCLRNKVTEDMEGLVKENSQLNQQIVELSRQLERVSETDTNTDRWIDR